MAFDPVDWNKVFAIDLPLLEILARGTFMYLAVFTILRVTGRRSVGELAMLDFIFVLFLAIAADRAMMGDQTSIGSGFVLLLTLFFWNYLLNWLSYHVRPLERLVAPAPLPIVRNGQMIKRNMRKEFVTEEELHQNLREQGCDDIAAVKLAVVEGDGNISVIMNQQANS